MLVLSCASTSNRITFDPDLPPEKTTVVTFTAPIQVTQYNGIGVLETWYPNSKYSKKTIALPAGSSNITFNLRGAISVGNITYYVKADNIELRFDFAAEKEYTLGLYKEGKGAETFFLGRINWGVAIWDNSIRHDYKLDRAIRYWELGQT